MRRVPPSWQPVERLGQAVWPVVGIVSAFTVAHSITLGLAGAEARLADAGVHRAGDRGDDRPRRARQRPADLSGAARRRHVLLRPHPRLRLRRRARRAQPAARDFAWALLSSTSAWRSASWSIVAVATSVLFALRRWRGYPKLVIGAGSASRSRSAFCG
jgi:hypothetical protein